jgi:hypothetical protein
MTNNAERAAVSATKEMADYSAMKAYLDKNNIQYFTISPNSEKPIKAVIRHLPPYTPTEDISNSIECLGFSVINMKQLATNRRAPNGQTHVETLPLFPVTLIRNAKSQEIFKLNSPNNIIFKVGSYRAQTGLTQCYNCQNFSMSGSTASNPFNVYGVVVATCIRNGPKRRIQDLRRVAAIEP